MSIDLHQASAPVFVHTLGALSKILDKAAAHAKAKNIDPAVLLQARLAPDMFPLVRQVQSASDAAKGCMARLAGVPVPAMPDTETTFDELRERIGRTVEFVTGVPADAVVGAEDRPVVLKLRSGELNFTAQHYLLHFALPNFFFHVTTAYDILRHNGVELGKRDFLG